MSSSFMFFVVNSAIGLLIVTTIESFICNAARFLQVLIQSLKLFLPPATRHSDYMHQDSYTAQLPRANGMRNDCCHTRVAAVLAA